MGKKSKDSLHNSSEKSLSRRSSQGSISRRAMNLNKEKNRIKRIRRKKRNSIQCLFSKLRDETLCETSNNSVIILDDSNTARPKKRKASNDGNEATLVKQAKSNPCIVIKDDDVIASTVSCSSPVSSNLPKFSSTPLAKSSNRKLQELNISSVSVSSNKNELSKRLNEEINNLTKEINKDSYLTIDLTKESEVSINSTVIDLVNTTDDPKISLSTASLSMSGDSEVTVINTEAFKKDKSHSDQNKMKKIADRIDQMNSNEKGRLLQYITKQIFNGCNISTTRSASFFNLKESANQATETAENVYIKETILGQTASRNSIGSNIYNPLKDIKNRTGQRMVVIDGSNVAMEHGRGKFFSVNGLKICIDYFLKRGHVVKAFVPRFRCKFGKSSNPRLLDEMERQGLVVYTPSRELSGRFIASYDDRYIVQCAAEFDGVIVSGDNYRDLLQENPRWRFIIENRVLPFTWVNDMIMFPRDPLGRNGPTLEQLLNHPK